MKRWHRITRATFESLDIWPWAEEIVDIDPSELHSHGIISIYGTERPIVEVEQEA